MNKKLKRLLLALALFAVYLLGQKLFFNIKPFQYNNDPIDCIVQISFAVAYIALLYYVLGRQGKK